MRLLHVIGSIAPRLGGPSNILNLARALVRQGHDVSVFTTDLDEPGTLWPWRPPQRLPVPTDRPVLDHGLTVRYFRANWPSRYACSWAMMTALRDSIPTFDLVHIHSLYLFHGLVAAYYCRRAGVPYIMRPHGTLDRWFRRRRRWGKAVYNYLVEERNLRHAAAIHYTSSTEAEFAREAGVSTPGFVTRLGIALEEYQHLPPLGRFRAQRPELADRQLIVFLGRITPEKGFDLLIPAFREVVQSQPAAHLVIAGPDAQGYAKTVQEWVRQAGLDGRVTWTGLVTGEDKLSLLRDADVWVLPSHSESFGLAVIEAMAAGAAVLLTDRVGVHQAVRQAGAGLVVEPTVPAIAGGLARLLADRQARDTLSQRGRALAFNAFTWDAVAQDLAQVYHLILAQGGRLPAHLPERADVGGETVTCLTTP